MNTMPSSIPTDAYAMIIGAMKCGTTSLFNYLKNHPEICPAITKEPEFFSVNQTHGVRVDHYHDLFPFNPSVHRYALEASTGYAKYPADPNVAKSIFDYGINPKFIYIIRNPFERIVSHFILMKKVDPSKSNIVNNHVINVSKYFTQLEQYRRYFPLENILLLDFDSLKNDPAHILNKVYKFLNIDSDYFPETYKIENVTYEKIFLKESDKSLIHDRLKEDMENLRETYSIDISRWGF